MIINYNVIARNTMTDQEKSSPQDAHKRFKDLLKEAELAEKQAEQLAEELEAPEEPAKPHWLEETAAQTLKISLEEEQEAEMGHKAETRPFSGYEAETEALPFLEATPPPPLGTTPYTPPPSTPSTCHA